MNSYIFGATASGLPIPAYTFGSSGKKVLIIGGVHGDEVEGVVAAHGLLGRFANSFSYKLQVVLVPALNLDGFIANQRQNSNGIDLNRNLPTNDWSEEFETDRYNPGPEANSEPENQALVKFIDDNRPEFILSLHSWKPMLNINGRCEKIAETIAKHTGDEINNSIGYPTPGCLGTYCGLERDVPTLTYEIERGMDTATTLKTHIQPILEGLKVAEEAIN